MFGLPADVISLIILILCIILFVSERVPMAATAILGCAMMVACGVAPAATVFGQFASSSVLLVISVMVVGKAMLTTGLAQYISKGILCLAGNSERKLLLASTLICALISSFMSNVATLAMFISILSNLSVNRKKVDLRNIMLPVAMGSVVGGVCTLIGSAPQMSTQGILEETVGAGFPFFAYAKVGVILVAGLCVYVYFIGYPLGKRIWGERPMETGSLCADDAGQDINTDKRKRYIMAGIFLCMDALFFFEPVPISAVGALAAFMCIITGCIDYKTAIKSIHWGTVGKLAGCLGIMQAINQSGGGRLIARLFLNLVEGKLDPYFLFAAMCALTMALSEFISNTTALMIVLPIALHLAPAMGFNIYTFAMGITLSSSVALSSPLSCTPLTMAMDAGYRFSDYAKYSFPFDLLALATIVIAVPIFYPL